MPDDMTVSTDLGGIRFDLSAQVADSLGELVALPPASTSPLSPAGGGHAFSAADVDLAVTFAPVDGGLCCRIEAAIANESLFQPVRSFAADGPVRLSLKPTSPIDGVMGNRYTILTCWAAPFFCAGLGEAPREIASLLWRVGDTYYHMLPLCDGDFRSDLHGNGEGLDVWTSSFCAGSPRIEAAAFVLCWGADPFELAERAAAAGFAALGQRRRLRRDKRLPELFEYLGWCSWDGFHRDVTADGITAKARELHDLGVPVKWFLIDDGWSPSRDEKLLDFEVDLSKFPGGLRPLVADLKERFGLRWIGAWQNFMGYWQGMHPDGRLVRERSDLLYHTNDGRWMPPPDEAGSFAFWNEWNSYLSAEGIDFVKSDSQSTAAVFLQDDVPLGRGIRGLHRGLEASAGASFGGAVINCTGMGHETTWHHPEGMVARNSGDYNPTVPETIRDFIVQNVYNSYYYSQIYHTDWDMWWSRSPTTKLSVILHAVSGSIVYISDKVGETDAASVLPFALPSGRLLRCDALGMPTEDALLVDPLAEPVPLKVWNTASGAGVLAAFNVYRDGAPVRGAFRASDIPGLQAERLVVYDWYARRCTAVAADEPVPIELDADDAALYLLLPADGDFAPIGLIDKYIAPAAIRTRHDLSGRCALVLETGGVFAYTAQCDHTVRVDGQPCDVEEGAGFFQIDCATRNGEVLVELLRD